MAGCVPLLGGIPALKPLLRQAEAAMDSMDYDRAQALYRRVANSYDVALTATGCSASTAFTAAAT